MLVHFLHCNYCNCDKTLENVEEPLLTSYIDSNNIRSISQIDIAQLMDYESPFLCNKISS
jgi:hypothetical protein